MSEPSEPVSLYLVCDVEAITAAVRIAFPPPHTVQVFSTERILDDQNVLSEYGKELLRTAASAAAVLVAWDLDKAPVINTVCYHTHQRCDGPVMALCGGHPEEQVAALAAGIDDTLTFPLYPPLVLMKAAAYRRRMAALRTLDATSPDAAGTTEDASADSRNRLQFGDLRVDRRARRFYVQDQEVPLTPREFKLLDYLIENANAACTRDQILDHVWGITFDTGTNMVDVYMYFLRKKLAAYGLKDMIQTIRGHGYRLTLNPQETP